MSNNFENDNAINKKINDKLNRVKYVEQLSSKILNYNNKESLVIGLSGQWGSGKTSILKMIIETINETSINDFILIEFNPWYFSNQKELIDEFFKVMINALSNNNKITDKLKKTKLINLIKKYSSSLVDNINEQISIKDKVTLKKLIKTAPRLQKDVKNAIEIYTSLNADILELKEDINKYINENEVKILFIIDDIDRLSDIEVEQIFKLVKLVADFNKTIYLLTYDKKVVSDSLDKTQHEKGYEYLEKIVQIPLDIPKISKNDLFTILFKKVQLINEDFDEKTFRNMYYGLLEKIFNNLREVKRFCNVLNFNYSNLENEVNFIDFFYLTIIQVFSPDTYEKLFSYKDFLLEINDISIPPKSKEDIEFEKTDIIENIISNKKENNINKIFNSIIRLLFPQLGLNTEDYLNGIWNNNLKICTYEHFDKYFEMNIPDKDITNEEFEKIIYSSNNYSEFELKLEKIDNENKISIFLNRFLGYSYERNLNLELINIKNIIKSFFELGDFFNETTPKSWLNIYKIINNLLKTVDKTERFDILQEAILESNSSFWTAQYYVYQLDYNYKKIEKSGKIEDYEYIQELNILLTRKETELMQEIILAKIQDYLNEVKIENTPCFSKIITFWEYIDSENAMEFLKDKLSDENYLISFITSFLESTHVSSKINGKTNEIGVLEFISKNIYSLVPIESFKDTVDNILRNNVDLNSKNRKALSLFIEEKTSIDENQFIGNI